MEPHELVDSALKEQAFAFSERFRYGILFGTTTVSLASTLLTLQVVKIRTGGSGASVANVLCAVVIGDSLLFVVMTIVHQLWQDSDFMCWFGFYSCAFLYASSKVLVYLFMIEKQYVASSGRNTPRQSSTAYRLNLVLLSPFVALLVLMLVYGSGERHFGEHGIGCHIGLAPESALPLAFYDTLFTLGLTLQFARLTLQANARVSSVLGTATKRRSMASTRDTSGAGGVSRDKLHAVGLKNLKGSALSLMSTMANLTSLAVSPYGLPMTACYSFCTLDVLINCWVAFRMTSRGPLFSCSCPFGVRPVKSSIKPNEMGATTRPQSHLAKSHRSSIGNDIGGRTSIIGTSAVLEDKSMPTT